MVMTRKQLDDVLMMFHLKDAVLFINLCVKSASHLLEEAVCQLAQFNNALSSVMDVRHSRNSIVLDSSLYTCVSFTFPFSKPKCVALSWPARVCCVRVFVVFK